MGFGEIIDMLYNATSYIELYDILAYVENDELRCEIENKVTELETSATDLEQAIQVVIEILSSNTILQDEKELITAIENTGNDKDLINLLDEIADLDTFSEEFSTDLRQLFKNNRYTVLSDKKDTLIKFIKQYGNVLTESKDIENTSFKDILKNQDEKEMDQDAGLEENNQDTLKLLKKRIGQQMSIGELNTVLQSLFGQYNKVFLLLSDLYNKDLDKTQSVNVTDDNAVFTIDYDIIDMDSGLIEIKDAHLKESEVDS